MSILIKGMEMPKECRECPLEMYYMNSGETRCRVGNKILAENFKTIPFDGRPDWCPLEHFREGTKNDVSDTNVGNKNLIDRQSAIDKFEPWLKVKGYSEGERNMLKAVLYELTVMPPTQPEQKWIPCSETSDIPDHEVMACDGRGEFIIRYLDCKDEQWICESDDSIMYDSVAWCELPKPYKEGGADG